MHKSIGLRVMGVGGVHKIGVGDRMVSKDMACQCIFQVFTIQIKSGR